ncbi:MAG: BCCT family transporter [Bacteroidia bacterium]|nr:BCCT family transporter [Bacteroidia bacterium]
MKLLNRPVFFPPLIFLLLTVGYSLFDPEGFLQIARAANQWILDHVGWLFSWGTFSFVVMLAVVYVSPLGKVRIGGADARPILTKWRWFAITLCTTIATGILFWGPAEPLHHLHNPPAGLGFASSSAQAATFSLSTMFMHWTITPYAMYTIAGLVFAIAYYNLKQPFSLGSMVYPLVGGHSHGVLGKVIDTVCLYGLVAGMAASLGTGLLSITGGLETVLGIEQSRFSMALIALAIVATFIISSASGLMKGIRLLSDINAKAFIGLATFVFIFGPTVYMLQEGGRGLLDFLMNFVPRSVTLDAGIDEKWLGSWTIFYWANWLAWTPITALFLGQLSVGYTVRNYIRMNLLFPSLFSGLWMMIFGGASMKMDMTGEGSLFGLMQLKGEENVIYSILGSLPWGHVVSGVFLVIMFISFVTAADSNTSAMSGISTRGITPENPEAPFLIKLIWGLLIGTIAYVMVSTAGVDGIKMMSILGGFPSLFLVIAVAFGVVKLMGMAQRGEL